MRPLSYSTTLISIESIIFFVYVDASTESERVSENERNERVEQSRWQCQHQLNYYYETERYTSLHDSSAISLYFYVYETAFT